MTSRGLAAVTGATGFLGRRLVPALAAAGWRVRVMARAAPLADPRAGCAPEIVVGDLEDRRALAALADGARVFIHAAGSIKAPSRAAFFAVNEAGAARAARAAPPGSFILISSLAAREPGLSAYAASKRAGEMAASEATGGRLAILRPPAIYGPGDRETLGLFRLAARSRLLPVPGSSAARLALAHVDDVVAAIVDLAGRAERPVLATIGGARPEGYGWREILACAAGAVGRSPSMVPVPAGLLLAAAGISEILGLASGKASIFTRGKAREILHADWSVSPAEQDPSAPAARFTLEKGFADTVAWCRSAGWLR